MAEPDDPVDRPDFNPVAFINEQFPTEAAMKRFEPFVARVNSNIAQLDREISRAVEAQAAVCISHEENIMSTNQRLIQLFNIFLRRGTELRGIFWRRGERSTSCTLR